MTRLERFMEKVSKPGCLIWLGARNVWGYGTFCMGGRKNINASRAAWILLKGEIPAGLDVLHTCNNRRCVNVEHLYLGTDADNTRDRERAGTIPRGEASPTAKLTEEQVRTIRREYRKVRNSRGSGKQGPWSSNAKELAGKYGVSIGTITNAAAGRRTWRHL